MTLSIIILAAGQGKRMKSSLPKVLHPLAGVPLLQRVVNTAQELGAKNIYVVYGNGGGLVRNTMQRLDVQWIEQTEQLGTGHAVMQALPAIPENHQVLILYGDVPLISKKTLQKLLDETPKNSLGILIAERANPFGYGRMLRDATGKIIAIVEQKDASLKQRKIKEINTGILTTTAKRLKEWLPKLANHNAQKEYYLTDVVALAVLDGCEVAGVIAESVEETQGVNDHVELAKLERYYQQQIAQQLMLQGVTLMDPNRIDVRGELIVDKDVVIDVNVIAEGKVNIGANSKIGPNNFLRNVEIGRNVEIYANCVLEDAKIADGCRIGPFARIRPGGSELAKNVHVGNFVEIKKVQLGENSKANHLAYIGDAVIGKNVNVGAGVITCNYDGANKYQTTIKDGAFIGSDSQLIAPVTIGENAYIGSGSTINKDAPPNKLTIARAKQVTIDNWKPPKKSKS